ncbi:MAG: LysR family transcriptional regulator [Pseudomonadota bacterium]
MIYRLNIFRCVYEERGFSLAAKRLGLTQSAVSQQVKLLEEELDVKLFEQNDRSNPTNAGDYLYKKSGLLLTLFDDLKSDMMSLEGKIKGRTKFGMIDVAAISLLPKILKKFKLKFPDVQMEAEVKPSGELIRLVDDYRLDFCVAVAYDLEEHLEKRVLYRDSIVAMVNRNSPMTKQKQISIKNLKGEPLILYPASSYSRKLIEDTFRSKGIIPTIAMEMHYPAAIISLVEQGMGVGLLSELSASGEKLKGEKMIRIKELKESRDVAIVYRKDRELSPQAKTLIDMILNEKKRGE